MGFVEIVLFVLFVAGLCSLWYTWRDEVAQLRSSRRVVFVTAFPAAHAKENTRGAQLAQELGIEGLRRLRRLLVEANLKQLLEWKATADADLEVLVSGCAACDADYWLRRLCPAEVRLRSSIESSSLRKELLEAVEVAKSDGVEQLILVLGDMPLVRAEDIAAAFRTLGPLQKSAEECSETDAVMMVAPSDTGGCPLLGLSLARAGVESLALFGSHFAVPWDEPNEELLRKALLAAPLQLGMAVATLPVARRQVSSANLDSVLETWEAPLKRSALQKPVLSVVVPTLNEEENIETVLLALAVGARAPVEIVLSDGESKDKTVERAQELLESEQWPKLASLKVVQGKKGRGRQLNRGAAAATGDALIFVHADTRLPSSFDEKVLSLLDTPGVLCGAFSFAVDVGRLGTSLQSVPTSSSSSSGAGGKSDASSSVEDGRFFTWQMRALEFGTNMRASNLELPYGDQALFCTSRLFNSMHGFADQPLLEDVDFVQRVRKQGHVAILPELAVTSARRWRRSGWLLNTGFNQLILMGYAAGVDPITLAEWYYGMR